MARASPHQLDVLITLRNEVMTVMEDVGLLDAEQRNLLLDVPLGVLRSNSTQRHGVTRWKADQDGQLTVEVVDLNPHLLNEAWQDYAAFVLFHEFLHVMGYRAHDRVFRTLESMWPDAEASSRGKAFTHARRMARATWHWVCSTCDERILDSGVAAVGTCAGDAERSWSTCPVRTLNEILAFYP